MNLRYFTQCAGSVFEVIPQKAFTTLDKSNEHESKNCSYLFLDEENIKSLSEHLTEINKLKGVINSPSLKGSYCSI